MKKVGKNITWFDCVTSTNDIALERSCSDDDMSVYAAEFQSAGRGQKGNKWSSKRGENLTFSILLKPSFLPASEQYIISMVATLGITAYLKDKIMSMRDEIANKEIKIKWPNDIYIGDKKICGMLIENSLSANEIGCSIVGIGLNINQREFPEELLNPTSLSLETGINNYQTHNELEKLIDFIFAYYHKAQELKKKGDFTPLVNEYLKELYRFNQVAKFVELREISATKPVATYSNESIKDGEHYDNIITARIVGITPQFCLILELSDGTQKEYAFKEIAYVI